MKLFSDCSGDCFSCACSGFCLAGHGDDDYTPASKEEVLKRYYDKTKWISCKNEIKKYLENTYGIEVDPIDVALENIVDPKEIERTYVINSLSDLEYRTNSIIENIIKKLKEGTLPDGQVKLITANLISLKNTIVKDISITSQDVSNLFI